jgi:hypothetical protein
MSTVRAFAIACLAAVACSDAPMTPVHPPPDTAFVSPDGDDRAGGTREAPFRTVSRALSGEFSRIVLLLGAHPPFRVRRSVILEGEDALVLGVLRIEAEQVTLRALAVDGGVEVLGARDLRVETTTVSAGAEPHALRIAGGTALLRHVTMECGSETCLFASGATLAIDRLEAGGPDTQRVLRFEGGNVTIDRARLDGGSIASLQIEARARALVRASELIAGSNGLVALDRSELTADDVAVTGARRTSLLLESSIAEIEGGSYSGTPELTAGITGSRVVLREVSILPSGFAAISISRHFDRPSSVEIDGGTIDHASRSAILVDGSELGVRGTRFVGAPDGEGDDAVTGFGEGTLLTIEGATFEAPGGFGVGLFSGASGVVSATIEAPRLGGVLVDASTATITGSLVTGCREGSGVVVQASATAVIDRVRVEGCSEAGVLANGGSGSIRSSSLIDNLQFGAAAFAAGSLFVTGSTISGSPFATFAICGDGSRVDLGPGNRIEGSTIECP